MELYASHLSLFNPNTSISSETIGFLLSETDYNQLNQLLNAIPLSVPSRLLLRSVFFFFRYQCLDDCDRQDKRRTRIMLGKMSFQEL